MSQTVRHNRFAARERAISITLSFRQMLTRPRSHSEGIQAVSFTSRRAMRQATLSYLRLGLNLSFGFCSIHRRTGGLHET